MTRKLADPQIAIMLAAMLAALLATIATPDRARAGESAPRELSPSTSHTQGVVDTRSTEPRMQRPPVSDYRVDTGDRISITVYQEPDLSVSDVRVKADGSIAFPLLGDLHVAGLTSQELQALVTRRLLDGYLKKPSVTVSIDRYRLYYIKGEVTRPGGYSFVDGLTVAKAVALAGGFTVRASEKDISLVRESDPEQSIERVGPNAPILPGDIITVGESFF